MSRQPVDRQNMTGLSQSARYRPYWLALVAASVLAFNSLDALFTVFWIRAGYAQEANVLMRDLAHGDPVSFVLVKCALVGLGVLLLWRLRQHSFAVAGLVLGLCAYYLIVLYHLQFSGQLVSALLT